MDARILTNILKDLCANRLVKKNIWSKGLSGGILIMWDKRYWKGELMSAASQVITCKFIRINQVLAWHLSVVYADRNTLVKMELWNEFEVNRNNFEGPWVVCGDFNVTRFVSKRSIFHSISKVLDEFSKCISDFELWVLLYLEDLLHGEGGGDCKRASRIDKFLSTD